MWPGVMAGMATVRVALEVRDELRRRAAAQGASQGAVVAGLLAATDVERTLDEVDRDWAPLMDRLVE